MDAVILIGVVLLVILVSVWAVISSRKALQTGGSLTDAKEEDSILESFATVTEKRIEKIMTGTYQMPGHYLAYMVQFRFDDGKETSISVPQEMFDDIPVGSRELLITQGGKFLDFGGRFGEDLPDKGSNNT